MATVVDPRKSLLAYARSSIGVTARASREHEPVEVIDGRYRVRRALGRGGMGTVFLAEDMRLGREVAVKLLAPELGHTDSLRRRFLEEARAMGGLRHDHVAQVYSYGTHGIEPYIVMEYVPGETVSDFAHRAVPIIDVESAVRIVDQIARGLSAIHSAGIIHGDIKPSNVLVGPHFRAVVVDFGLMRWLGDAEDLSIVVGTPAYIPPEVVKADSIELRLTPAADVFALGVTAYELLTRRLPFAVTNVDELFEVHLANMRAPRISSLRPDLPPAFDDVFDRVLSGNLSERHRSADEFRRSLLGARDAAAKSVLRRTLALALPDGDLRTSLAVALEEGVPGLVVTTVNDWNRLARVAEADRTAILVIDRAMFAGDARASIAALPRTTRGDARSLLIVGADATAADHRTFRELGAAGLLPSPIDAATLVGVVRSLAAQGI